MLFGLFKEKKENEIQKINRKYNFEIIHNFFYELYSISSDYLIAYLNWSGKYGINIQFSKNIENEVKNKNDFEYYVTIKKYFEDDFKLFLNQIKNKYKPGTYCFIKKKAKEEIEKIYENRSEYINYKDLKINSIIEDGYIVSRDSGRKDFFYNEWIIGSKKDEKYEKLVKRFNKLEENNNYVFILTKEKFINNLILESNNNLKLGFYIKTTLIHISELLKEINNIEELKIQIENKNNVLKYCKFQNSLEEEGIKIELKYFKLLLDISIGK